LEFQLGKHDYKEEISSSLGAHLIVSAATDWPKAPCSRALNKIDHLLNQPRRRNPQRKAPRADVGPGTFHNSELTQRWRVRAKKARAPFPRAAAALWD